MNRFSVKEPLLEKKNSSNKIVGPQLSINPITKLKLEILVIIGMD